MTIEKTPEPQLPTANDAPAGDEPFPEGDPGMICGIDPVLSASFDLDRQKIQERLRDASSAQAQPTADGPVTILMIAHRLSNFPAQLLPLDAPATIFVADGDGSGLERPSPYGRLVEIMAEQQAEDAAGPAPGFGPAPPLPKIAFEPGPEPKPVDFGPPPPAFDPLKRRW